MKSTQRFALALVIMLSGLLLTPFIVLPRESFRWQLFRGAYEDGPRVTINYSNGASGSFFLITGTGFAPGQTLVIKANGEPFTTILADQMGEFELLISTTGNGLGRYVIAVDDDASEANTAVVLGSTSFELTEGAPLRERPAGTENLTPVVVPNLPAGVGNERSWLPFVNR